MSLTYGLIKARYHLYSEDGPDDGDLPDEHTGSGEVDLIPASTLPMLDATVGRGVVLVPVHGLRIVDGILQDREGRDGVKLVSHVDGQPVAWHVTVRLQTPDGEPLITLTHTINEWPTNSPVMLHQLPPV